MFPDYLDGARVLEHTNKDHFGFIIDYSENDTPIEKEICYLAICRYETGGFYVFSCDNQHNVLMDSYLDTIEHCKTFRNLPETAIWIKK